jgi:hypothetical protein
MGTTTAVEIPADVRDNSETVTDYAFMRDRAQSGYPYHTIETRDQELSRMGMFPHLRLVWYTWDDVNPDGQRCRFDMIVDRHGEVVNLYHTEYWTRAACAECAHSYASVYQVVETADGTSEAVARCDEHAHYFRRACAGTAGLVLRESERLRVGQHD